jgi:hypothetical protein
MAHDQALCPDCGTADFGYAACRECGFSLRDADLPSAGMPQPKAAQVSAYRNDPPPDKIAAPQPSVFARAATQPGTAEYVIRAGYWCAALTIVLPVLAFPAIGFGFLAVIGGRPGTYETGSVVFRRRTSTP